MDFTEEQEMLQRSVGRFFEKEVTPDLVRTLQSSESTGHSQELWNKIARAGWLAVAIDEKYDGAGGTLLDLGIVYEESGRTLVPTTFYSTVFAGLLINELGSENQKAAYLPQIASGEMIGTVAYLEPQAIHNTDCYQTIARKDKGFYYLTGTKAFVPNANLANQMIVIARTENHEGKEGLTAFLVPPQAEGVTISDHKTFGKDRQSMITFTEVELGEENVLGISEEAAKGLSNTIQKATALQCLEMAGGAQKVIQMTVNYVSERKQFGVPIGSFQAVQHHMANMATWVDGARLLSYQAISLLSDGLPAESEVAVAKAYTSEAYKNITVLAHQLWGGMGYATESDLFLWSNRAKATELSFGTKDYHLNQVSAIIASTTK